LATTNDLAAAIAGGFGLAEVPFSKRSRTGALEFRKTRSLEHFDGEIATPLQMRYSEFQGQLGQMHAARLVDGCRCRTDWGPCR
jgi:hypothetical protein